MEPGSVKGLHLVVADMDTARAALVRRGIGVGDVTDMGGGEVCRVQRPGRQSVAVAGIPARHEAAWTELLLGIGRLGILSSTGAHEVRPLAVAQTVPPGWVEFFTGASQGPDALCGCTGTEPPSVLMHLSILLRILTDQV
jgi:hypothetical protein